MKNRSFKFSLRKDKSEKRSIKNIILLVILIIVAIIQLYPLIWLVLVSFKNNAEIFGGNVLGIPKVWRISNYKVALTSGKVGLYFFNSLIVTAITIIVSDIFIATASYAVTRMKWKYNKIVLTIFLLGMMVPIHSTLLPLFLIEKKLHILNTYWAVIIPYIAFALPMGIFVMTGFLEGIPYELEEAACLDGCNIYQAFFKIVLPLLKPSLATVSIFTYLSSWNELMFANTFLNNPKLKTLTVGIMSMAGEHSTDWGPIVAGLVIATLPTILIYIPLSNQVQKSLMAGAVKG
ncbi:MULTISPECIES: carbohydrate ABC transporter permease [Clostridium]|uniref:carbohydrate ABC transporter permease n=1 Tax=Clostridium TaxID=1485 RepID=UPI00099A4C50|nr:MULTISPECIES: carbohydrate ABC transporter permease [Clostridium]